MMSDTICTGSHLNQRTFKEDEYWESFQSTLISGQLMSAVDPHEQQQEETSVSELSTMIEDDLTEENALNMNLDAIPDADLDDMFFDCPTFEKSPANLVKGRVPVRILSPRPYTRPQFYVVQFCSPPDTNNNNSYRGNKNNIDIAASPRKQRPESARRISPAKLSASTVSASSSHVGMNGVERTGSLLVQMAEEFNDLKDHAQSTPKLSSDSGNPSSGSFTEEVSSSRHHPHESSDIDKIRKTLDFQMADTIVIPREQPENSNEQQQDEVSASNSKQQDKVNESNSEQQDKVNISNKENFFNGKYSKFASTRRGVDKPSPLRTRKGKVKLLAGFFQSFAESSSQVKSLSKSRIPLPVHISSQLLSHVKKSPQVKARPSGSPTYQTRKSYKLISSRSSSASNNAKSRPATATIFTSSGSESFLTRNQRKFAARTSRVQSCSDATNAEIVTIDETCKSHSAGDLPSDSSLSIKAHNTSKITMRTYLTTKKSPMKKLSPPKKVSAINNRRSVGAQLKKNMSPVKPVKELCKLFTPKRNAGKGKQNSLVLPKIVITHQ